MKTKEIEEAKQNIFGLVETLRNYPEEDIIHDFGSMERFLEILTDEITKLMSLYDYKLSSKENELLKKVVNI